MRKYVFISVAVLLGIAGAITYYSFDPSHSHLFPKCIFHSLTGLLCPGCGSQRAMHSLLNGDIAGSIRYNAMFLPSLAIIAVYGIGEVKRTSWVKFYMTINSKKAIWTIFTIIVVWWVTRNIFGW